MVIFLKKLRVEEKVLSLENLRDPPIFPTPTDTSTAVIVQQIEVTENLNSLGLT